MIILRFSYFRVLSFLVVKDLGTFWKILFNFVEDSSVGQGLTAWNRKLNLSFIPFVYRCVFPVTQRSMLKMQLDSSYLKKRNKPSFWIANGIVCPPGNATKFLSLSEFYLVSGFCRIYYDLLVRSRYLLVNELIVMSFTSLSDWVFQASRWQIESLSWTYLGHNWRIKRKK